MSAMIGFFFGRQSQKKEKDIHSQYISPILLLISNFIDKLYLPQILGTKITETNKLLKTGANEVY